METQTSYRTFMISKLRNLDERSLLNAILGLTGESGECADLLKKNMFHGHVLDFAKMVEELGDIRFYLEQATYAMGVSMKYIEEMNMEKLNKRYPEGFESERSINRKD